MTLRRASGLRHSLASTITGRPVGVTYTTSTGPTGVSISRHTGTSPENESSISATGSAWGCRYSRSCSQSSEYASAEFRARQRHALEPIDVWSG